MAVYVGWILISEVGNGICSGWILIPKVGGSICFVDTNFQSGERYMFWMNTDSQSEWQYMLSGY